MKLPEQNCKQGRAAQPFELSQPFPTTFGCPETMLDDAQRRAIDDVIQTINGYAAGRRVLSVMFQELPDQEAWKEYYAVIPEPRSLGGIKVSFVARQTRGDV